MSSDFRTDLAHQLWLLYLQLKDCESNESKRSELLEKSRIELGQIINGLYAGRSRTANSQSSALAYPPPA